MQTLPRDVLEHLLLRLCFDGNAENDKTSVALAATCKTLNNVFQNSGAGAACKQRALQRLLKATFAGASPSVNEATSVQLTLNSRKTVRLVRWVSSGYISIEDFWETGQQHLLRQRNMKHNCMVRLTCEEGFTQGLCLKAEEAALLQFNMRQLQRTLGPVKLAASLRSCGKAEAALLTKPYLCW